MARSDLYDVLLKGTWSHPRTTTNDIHFMRVALLDQSVDVRFVNSAGIHGSFTAKRGTKGIEVETRTGRFSVVVSRVFATNRTDAKRRALQLLKYHAKDLTCRVPQLKADLEKSTTRRVKAPYEWMLDDGFWLGR